MLTLRAIEVDTSVIAAADLNYWYCCCWCGHYWSACVCGIWCCFIDDVEIGTCASGSNDTDTIGLAVDIVHDAIVDYDTVYVQFDTIR